MPLSSFEKSVHIRSFCVVSSSLTNLFSALDLYNYDTFFLRHHSLERSEKVVRKLTTERPVFVRMPLFVHRSLLSNPHFNEPIRSINISIKFHFPQDLSPILKTIAAWAGFIVCIQLFQLTLSDQSLGDVAALTRSSLIC